jgi:hypothetical protein
MFDPRLNRENHSKVCGLPMTLSPKAVLSILCVFNAVLPIRKQNFTQICCCFKSPVSRITENRVSHLKCRTINTRWEVRQRVMSAKLTRLTHKIAIQLHLVAESCIIRSSRSKLPVRILLDTPSYHFNVGRTTRSPLSAVIGHTDFPCEDGRNASLFEQSFMSSLIDNEATQFIHLDQVSAPRICHAEWVSPFYFFWKYFHWNWKAAFTSRRSKSLFTRKFRPFLRKWCVYLITSLNTTWK